MPWYETNVVEQRLNFIRAWLTKRYTKTELCRQFGISRPTGDKWLERHFEQGLQGLENQSCAPHLHPNAIAPWICERIVEEKRKRPYLGAKKILGMLRLLEPGVNWPCDSSGDNILARAGLVVARKKRKKVPADSQPFSECIAPNQCWSIDFKGQFTLNNQRLCYPLTLSDNYSRYLFACEALPNTQRVGVEPMLTRIFAEYGLPWSIRSDNGAPFASTALGGLSALSKWLIDLGIRPERIKVGHPEQNGRHERMHRSLKAFLNAGHIKQDFAAQQAEFDIFLNEYNTLRVHESLDRKTPASVYTPSSRIYSGKIEPYDYGGQLEIRRVKGSGEIKWRNQTFYLSQVLAGEYVALVPCGDGLWDIFYRFHLLGQMDDRAGKITPITQWH